MSWKLKICILSAPKLIKTKLSTSKYLFFKIKKSKIKNLISNDNKSQNTETGLRQECSAAAEPTSTSGLSMAVASPEHLRIVQVPLFMVHLLAEHNAGDCLRGCLMICFDSSTKKASFFKFILMWFACFILKIFWWIKNYFFLKHWKELYKWKFNFLQHISQTPK